MVRHITVRPLGDGWTIRLDEIANDMVFSKGAPAERAARCLGAQLAKAGQHSEVRVYDRDGVLAGQPLCIPPSTS
jgi:hypothetical protein